MMIDGEVLHLIQDHKCVTQFIDALCCCIENDKVDVPNFIPMTNDPLIHEQLTALAEFVGKAKKAKDYE